LPACISAHAEGVVATRRGAGHPRLLPAARHHARDIRDEATDVVAISGALALSELRSARY
jgi:hypothetical protein